MRYYSYIYPNARIVGVEMDEENYQIAKQNTKDLDNCKLLNAAVSASVNGYVEYSKMAQTDGFHIQRDEDMFTDLVTVPSITINSIVDSFSLAHLDFVKMDIEGEEVSIFTDEKSDLSWLSRTSVIRVEVHIHPKYVESIAQKLQSLGFVVLRDPNHKSALIASRKDVPHTQL